MSNDDKKKRFPCFLVFFLLLLIAYPLSYGPYIWLIINGYISPFTEFNSVYIPLRVVVNDGLAPLWLVDLFRKYVRLFS